MDDDWFYGVLRAMRDFFLLSIVSLLLFSGHLAYVHNEQYFSAVLKTLFVVGLFCVWPFMTMITDDTWARVVPAMALALGAFVLIAKLVGVQWGGLCYWSLWVGWLLFAMCCTGVTLSA